MSIKVMSMVWDTPIGNSSKKLVLMCLADYSSDDGVSWPKFSSIAHKCELSERHVKRIVNELIEDGYLSKQPRLRRDGGNSSNEYVIELSMVGGG